MSVKAIVDGLRAADGYRGAAVYTAGQALFSEGIGGGFADVALSLLRTSPGAKRLSISAGGFTFSGFRIDGYDVMVKLAGRFPALPALRVPEPEFIDRSCESALPSPDAVRREAEAALRAFGLLDQ